MTHPLREAFARILMLADQQVHDGGPYPAAVDAAFAATIHDGDCTKAAHTCLLCLANGYRAEADVALPLILRHPAMREPSEVICGALGDAAPIATQWTLEDAQSTWRAGCDALAREIEEASR